MKKSALGRVGAEETGAASAKRPGTATPNASPEDPSMVWVNSNTVP
jgi:hypothetical protein